jgi:hypothetical protein
MKGHFFVLSIPVIALVLNGCGPKAGPGLNVKDKQAFDQAPLEVKQVWDRVQEADRTNGYALAVTLLHGLSQQPLPPEQKTAVSNETAALNKRMYAAAEKGNEAALEAIREIRRNPPNR